MPNDLPTDRLPTMAETRAMHEQAVRARKKQRLQKTLPKFTKSKFIRCSRRAYPG